MCEIARWIWERDSEVNVWLQHRGTILRWVFLVKRDAKLEECIRGFRAAALMSLHAKWYAAVVVGLYAELEPIEWKEMHGGAERFQL